MAGGAVLLAWSSTDLWWGTDTGLGLGLDRIALTSGTSTRVGTLPDDIVALTVLPEYLNSRAYTIFGGTSEVQRDIIAKVVLGM
mgnify:CR=1 FL=1